MLDSNFILFAVKEKHSQMQVADQATAERLHREADLLLRRLEELSTDDEDGY